jgi:hypothetical protein
MATYRQIQDDIRGRYGKSVKTCRIADVKASHGLTRGAAPNRISANARKYPCPHWARAMIEDSMHRFGMI